MPPLGAPGGMQSQQSCAHTVQCHLGTSVQHNRVPSAASDLLTVVLCCGSREPGGLSLRSSGSKQSMQATLCLPGGCNAQTCCTDFLLSSSLDAPGCTTELPSPEAALDLLDGFPGAAWRHPAQRVWLCCRLLPGTSTGSRPHAADSLLGLGPSGSLTNRPAHCQSLTMAARNKFCSECCTAGPAEVRASSAM